MRIFPAGIGIAAFGAKTASERKLILRKFFIANNNDGAISNMDMINA
jgi:hypothetical protein